MLHAHNYRGTIAIKGSMIDSTARHWITAGNVPLEGASARQTRDGDNFHITVLAPEEMRHIEFDLESYCQSNPLSTVDVVGFACIEKGHQQSWYVVVYCSWAAKLRLHLRLPSRDFHITLGFVGGDLHGGSLFHNIKTWNVDNGSICQLAQNALDSCIDCGWKENEADREIAIFRHTSYVVGCEKIPQCMKLLRNIGHWCTRFAPTVAADVALDIGYFLLRHGLPYGLALVLSGRPDILEACTLSGSFPQSFLGSAKIETMMAVLREINITLMERCKVAQRTGKGCAWTYYDHLFGLDLKNRSIDLVKVPRNFSWVALDRPHTESRLLPYLLAGSAYPGSQLQMAALRSVGIQHVITVHEEALPAALSPTVAWTSKASAFDLANHSTSSGLGIVAYHFQVVDRCPPTVAQLQAMCDIMDRVLKRSEGVLVHCLGGVGRTNTVIIAYLMWSQGMSAAEATAQVTAQRKIILSHSQKVCLQRWWEVCVTFRSAELTEIVSDSVTELPSSVVNEPIATPEQLQETSASNDAAVVAKYRTVAAALRLPPLIVLCGYAASGKSTFAKALAAASPYFVRINKDEMRGKNECENTLFDALTAINVNAKKGGGRKSVAPVGSVVSADAGTVVVDCCNLSASKRKEWCQLAHNPRAWCLFFDLSLDECKTGHPTIKSGDAGVRILDSMHRIMEPPSVSTATKEGFERLIVLKSEQEVVDLLASWRIPFSLSVPEVSPSEDDNSLLKFPRTSHIMNLGAATRDDKILSGSDLVTLVGSQQCVVVEEKLDGANMGVFINGEENKIVVQNRSHFISSKYHAQFGPLDHWLEQHTADLWSILTPGRHILYGEWLHATHSVKYTHLPGWFVAYDLYDRVTQSFASRDVLASLLATTSIPHVPLIYEGTIDSVEDLKAMISGTSKFNRTQREGIVARVCKNGRLVSRAKLVRADFIAGNERWNKSHKLETNSLAATQY